LLDQLDLAVKFHFISNQHAARFSRRIIGYAKSRPAVVTTTISSSSQIPALACHLILTRKPIIPWAQI
jgi:hypothetical protein